MLSVFSIFGWLTSVAVKPGEVGGADITETLFGMAITVPMFIVDVSDAILVPAVIVVAIFIVIGIVVAVPVAVTLGTAVPPTTPGFNTTPATDIDAKNTLTRDGYLRS